MPLFVSKDQVLHVSVFSVGVSRTVVEIGCRLGGSRACSNRRTKRAIKLADFGSAVIRMTFKTLAAASTVATLARDRIGEKCECSAISSLPQKCDRVWPDKILAHSAVRRPATATMERVRCGQSLQPLEGSALPVAACLRMSELPPDVFLQR